MNDPFTYAAFMFCVVLGFLIGMLYGTAHEQTHYRKWAYDNKVGEDYIGYDHRAYFRMKTDTDILREHGCLDK